MTGVSVMLHAGCAVIALVCAIAVLAAGRGRHSLLPAGVCLMIAFWGLSVAAAPATPLDGLAGALEIGRAGMSAAFLIVLCGEMGGTAARVMVRRFAIAGGVLLVMGLITVRPELSGGLILPSVGSPALLSRLSLALLIVLLAENLWRNVDDATGWHVNLPCIALGGLATFDILLYADAALSGAFAASFLDARAVLAALAAPLLVVAAIRDRRWQRGPIVSRNVVFYGATLLVAGTFLFVVGAVGETLRRLAGDWGGTAEVSLFAGAVMVLAVTLSARSARSRLRRLVVDHFFAERYDYRREWLRCVAALSPSGRDVPAWLRAVRAIADPLDSPAGVLLMRDGPTDQRPMVVNWVGSWNLPAMSLPRMVAASLPEAMGEGDEILVPASLPAGVAAELVAVYGKIWLIVPLLHHSEGLIGIVLLAPPRAPFPLDGEVYDLLRTLGREVAMFLAERSAAKGLADGRRVTEYAKRFAFVAHDVKNVSSQLTLLLANADDNIADPEFQQDMLLTVRAAAQRIDTLIARLKVDDGDGAAAAVQGTIRPAERLNTLVIGRRNPMLVQAVGDAARGQARISADRFDEVVTHLLDNAAEASAPGDVVNVVVRRDAGQMVVDIVDRGAGMAPEFIRDDLFSPLRTTKLGGSGIGAWQARELLRQAGGDLEVRSEPGRGTTMRLILPAVPACRPAVVHQESVHA